MINFVHSLNSLSLINNFTFDHEKIWNSHFALELQSSTLDKHINSDKTEDAFFKVAMHGMIKSRLFSHTLKNNEAQNNTIRVNEFSKVIVDFLL